MKKLIPLLFLFCIPIAYSTQCQAQGGIITTIAGNGVTQYIGDGYPATAYSLGTPYAMAMDKHKNLIIADFANLRIRKLTASDSLYTIAGNGTLGYTGDHGAASAATFNYPDGIAIDTAGNIYITDLYNDVVRKITAATGIITTVCGSGAGSYGGDGGNATAANMETPRGACLDAHGNIYIPDFGNHRIRKVNASTGIISTFAGNGVNAYGGDGGPATAANISFPSGVCTDMAGNLYIADWGNNAIRKVDAITGTITTVAGNNSPGFSGDGGPATNAQLKAPNCVFVDRHGNIFISDFNNNVIREVTTSGTIYTVAGNTNYGYSGDGGYAVFATLSGPQAVYVDDSDYMYIADGANSAIRKVTPRTSKVDEVNNAVSCQVYPNPSNGKFVINFDNYTADAMLAIYDITGHIVYENTTVARTTNIDLSSQPSGIYFLKLISAQGALNQKIIIQNN